MWSAIFLPRKLATSHDSIDNSCTVIRYLGYRGNGILLRGYPLRGNMKTGCLASASTEREASRSFFSAHEFYDPRDRSPDTVHDLMSGLTTPEEISPWKSHARCSPGSATEFMWIINRRVAIEVERNSGDLSILRILSIYFSFSFLNSRASELSTRRRMFQTVHRNISAYKFHSWRNSFTLVGMGYFLCHYFCAPKS